VNFGLLLEWIGNSIDSFGCGTVATYSRAVATGRTSGLVTSHPKPALSVRFHGGQLRHQILVDRAGKEAEEESLTSRDHERPSQSRWNRIG
jgi:hypothetical protein